jgi:hypothetical protein
LQAKEGEMKAVDYVSVSVLAVLAGFFGGFSARSILAEIKAPEASGAQAVKARSFQLVDEHGTTHAALDTMEGGSPALVFYDADHGARVVFEMSGGGDPRLFLLDRDGQIRTILGLGFDAAGSPFVRLRDKGGHVVWSIP